MKDLNNLAPRKVDWDLKRDLTKKLQKLEKLTKKAIAEIISLFWKHISTSILYSVI